MGKGTNIEYLLHIDMIIRFNNDDDDVIMFLVTVFGGEQISRYK